MAHSNSYISYGDCDDVWIDDKLSKQIFNAGEKVEVKVWRMPLHKNYD